MSKVAVVFWSGTGNTQVMAEAVAEGITKAGSTADLITSDAFSKAKAGEFDAYAFGCPSMGAEVLEESEFQPMWDDVKQDLKGKKIALFGSYGWGDGEWLRNWEEDCNGVGLNVVDTYMCNEAPDDDAKTACQALGSKLV